MKIDVINLHLSIYTAPACIGILLGTFAMAALLIWFKEGKNNFSLDSVDKSKMINFFSSWLGFSMLDTSSRVALLRSSSYINLSIRFTVHSSQFVVKGYELN